MVQTFRTKNRTHICNALLVSCNRRSAIAEKINKNSPERFGKKAINLGLNVTMTLGTRNLFVNAIQTNYLQWPESVQSRELIRNIQADETRSICKQKLL